MVKRKGVYTDAIGKLVDKDILWNYLTVNEMGLTEALAYHLVVDKNIERSRVAELLNVSAGRVTHAVDSGESKKFS